MYCWRCGGNGCDARHVRAQKHRCVNGKVWFQRCPARFHEPWVSSFLLSYRAYDDHGVLPASGGLYDQARSWWFGIRLCRVVEAGHRKRQAKREQDRLAAARQPSGSRR